MKPLSIILSFISVILIAYGYWGAFTKAGSKRYEEMDGMIPFFILIFGALLFLVALILAIILLIRYYKSK